MDNRTDKKTPKKTYDEVDLEQISLFDTVSDEDVAKRTARNQYYDFNALRCTEYFIQAAK